MRSVSVIIPCYNYGRFLGDCVASVLSQEGVDLEVLVIDDASMDDTPFVCATLSDPRLEVRRHEHNVGNIATFNEGLRWATGDYIVLISADDLLVPGALARASALLDAHQEVGFVYGGVIRFGEGAVLPSARTPTASSWEVRPGDDWVKARCLATESPIISPEVVVRGRLQHELGGYRPELPLSADLEMWLRFAAHGAVGRLPDADQAYYRFHSASMTRTRFNVPIIGLEQRKAAFDAFFSEHGRRLPNAQRLHRAARRSLASSALYHLVIAVLGHRRRQQAPGEIANLWRFASSCLREGSDEDLGFLRRTLVVSGRILATGASCWPRARLMALYTRSSSVRKAASPVLRALGAGPAWGRSTPGQIGVRAQDCEST